MKAVDTNVLARFILADDEAQTAAAAEILRGSVWIANTVWLELGWVLGRRLGLDRPVVAAALETMLAIETVHTADRAGLAWAIARYREGADWADMIHLVAARDAADAFVTFDQAIAAQGGTDVPIAIETLA